MKTTDTKTVTVFVKCEVEVPKDTDEAAIKPGYVDIVFEDAFGEYLTNYTRVNDDTQLPDVSRRLSAYAAATNPNPN